MNELVQKPWGSCEVLHEDERCKVNRLVVRPGHQLSYQFHYKRQEVWTIVQGRGQVTVGNEQSTIGPGTAVNIQYHVNHRLANPSEDTELVVIEVQTGEYLGEDDIVRLADEYGRTGPTPETKQPGAVDVNDSGIPMERDRQGQTRAYPLQDALD